MRIYILLDGAMNNDKIVTLSSGKCFKFQLKSNLPVSGDKLRKVGTDAKRGKFILMLHCFCPSPTTPPPPQIAAVVVNESDPLNSEAGIFAHLQIEKAIANNNA